MVSNYPLNQILHELPVPALLTDERKRIVYANRAFELNSGYGMHELLGANCRILQGPATSQDTVRRIRTALDGGLPFWGDILNYRKNGEPFWNSLAITPVRYAGEVMAYASVQFDVSSQVTERVQAAIRADSAEIYLKAGAQLAAAEDIDSFAATMAASATLAGAHGAALSVADTDGEFHLAARTSRSSELIGRDEWERFATRCVEALDVPLRSRRFLVRSSDPEAGNGAVRALMAEHGIGELLGIPVKTISRADATLLCGWRQGESTQSDPLVLERIGRLVVLGSTALDPVLSLHRTRTSVERDQLTGLFSRSGLHSRLEAALSRSARDVVGVAYADVDRFKRINDSLGHAGGDAFLEQFAERLTSAVDHETLIGRPGGDEFVFVFPHTDAVAQMDAMLSRIDTALAQPFDVHGQTLYGRMSLGRVSGNRASSETPKEAADRLVREADVAMYETKRHNPRSRPDGDSTLDSMSLEADLHRALERNEIETFFQPQYDCGTGLLTGFEALARWKHHALGYIEPTVFIPVAEDSGLIDEIGRRVMQQSLSFASTAAHSRPLRLAVNLSVHQMTMHGFVDEFKAMIAPYRGRPWTIVVEVGEQDLAANLARVDEVLTALSESGVEIAIDDFGTGYSSLALLQDLPVTELKVDRSFVRREGALGLEMVAAIINLARGLDLQVSADGVETATQLEVLQQLGCDRVQGFLLGPPLHASAALATPPTIEAALEAAQIANTDPWGRESGSRQHDLARRS